jgi:hypothetical protein
MFQHQRPMELMLVGFVHGTCQADWLLSLVCTWLLLPVQHDRVGYTSRRCLLLMCTWTHSHLELHLVSCIHCVLFKLCCSGQGVDDIKGFLWFCVIYQVFFPEIIKVHFSSSISWILLSNKIGKSICWLILDNVSWNYFTFKLDKFWEQIFKVNFICFTQKKSRTKSVKADFVLFRAAL